MAGPGAAEAEMPATVAAAWGVRERPQKGPKPTLSLARIVDAGVRVADSEGLDSVSMGRVAASLDTAPMSLYRHVSSKDELVRLMVDAAWGDSPGPALAGEDWRAGLSRWAWGFRAALRRHPWAGRIPISGLPIMPREIAWFEDALACMAGTGLTEARKASVIMLLSGYVRNLAATEADIAAAVAASGLGVDEWMASYPAVLSQLADPRRFPALTAFIAAGVFDTADGPDDEFIFGLDRILDGVGLLIGKLRGLEGEAVGDEADVADLPVAGGLAEVAAALVEALGGLHAVSVHKITAARPWSRATVSQAAMRRLAMPWPRAALSTASIRTSASSARQRWASGVPGRARVTVPAIVPSAAATRTMLSQTRERPSRRTSA